MNGTRPSVYARNNRRYTHGFTLLEIMLVITIIGLLTSIAVPSYNNYVTTQRRADARHLLQVNAQRLQRCLILAGGYDQNCRLLTTSKQGYYTLTDNRTARTWTLTATPTNQQNQDDDTVCTSFSLTHTGLKSAMGSAPEKCW